MVNLVIEGHFTGINKRYNRNFSLTKEYREFKERLVMNFKGTLKKGNYVIGIYVKTSKDIDALIKPILDALTEFSGVDDKYCVRLVIDKTTIKRTETEYLQLVAKNERKNKA